MTDDECRKPGCHRDVGTQDREDYHTGRYCSVACQLKYEHVKADAREAKRDAQREAEEQRGAW